MEPLYAVLTYWLNGLLALLDWLGEHWAALSARLLDAPQAKLAGERSRRYDRGAT